MAATRGNAAMPRFIFRFEGDDPRTTSSCAVRLPSFAAAEEWAQVEARNMVVPVVPRGMNLQTSAISIADEEGQLLAWMAVHQALALAAPHHTIRCI